jgi:hypothetical protein
MASAFVLGIVSWFAIHKLYWLGISFAASQVGAGGEVILLYASFVPLPFDTITFIGLIRPRHWEGRSRLNWDRSDRRGQSIVRRHANRRGVFKFTPNR